jgi:two-component system sensor histidine kinase ArlS
VGKQREDEANQTTANGGYLRLISLAVHELRTPASVVGGYLRMLQREEDTTLTERHRKMISEAERSCQRLVAIIGELSEVQKLDANLSTLGRQDFDLFPMIAELAKGVHEFLDREVELECRGQLVGAPIRGDLTRLQHAFSAIFRAVLREVPPNAAVFADRRLEKQGSNSWAVVIVGDERSVQTAYETARGPFDEQRGGLGLALPIARRIVERHGGSVSSPAGETGRRAAIVSLPLAE